MPIDLSAILPATLTEAQQTRRATPKHAIQTRLAVKVEKAVNEKKEWARVQREVWTRDHSRDRLTKRKVVKTLELDPKRGECHHIEDRANKAVRFDRRNVILLSLETHGRVTRHELRIVGTRFFVVDGKRYVDADHAVRFVKTDVATKE